MDEEIPRLCLAAEDVRGILHKRFRDGTSSEASSDSGGQAKKKPKRAKVHKLHGQFQRAMRRGSTLWSTPALATSAMEREDAGRMPTANVKAHLQARRNSRRTEHEELRPYTGATAPKASLYPLGVHVTIDEWLEALSRGDGDKPNEEQIAFLKHVAGRIKTETREELT